MKHALVFVALCSMAMYSLAGSDHIQPGEPLMTQADSTMNTLEKFNNPENFLATRSTFDVAAFRKKLDRGYSEYSFVREDGVHVRQIDDGDYGYQEEFTRPDSHYNHGYGYNKNGRLKGMSTRFFNRIVGEGLWFDEAGNIIKRKNFDGSFLSIGKLRERFLEQTGIDLYEKKKIETVARSTYAGKEYYDIYVRKEPDNLDSRELTAYLLDGKTGTLLFQGEAYRMLLNIETSAYWKYAEYLNSIGATHEEYLQELLSKENAEKAK